MRFIFKIVGWSTMIVIGSALVAAVFVFLVSLMHWEMTVE